MKAGQEQECWIVVTKIEYLPGELLTVPVAPPLCREQAQAALEFLQMKFVKGAVLKLHRFEGI